MVSHLVNGRRLVDHLVGHERDAVLLVADVLVLVQERALLMADRLSQFSLVVYTPVHVTILDQVAADLLAIWRVLARLSVVGAISYDTSIRVGLSTRAVIADHDGARIVQVLHHAEARRRLKLLLGWNRLNRHGLFWFVLAHLRIISCDIKGLFLWM